MTVLSNCSANIKNNKKTIQMPCIPLLTVVDICMWPLFLPVPNYFTSVAHFVTDKLQYWTFEANILWLFFQNMSLETLCNIAEALTTNTKLTTLNMANVRCTDKVAKVLDVFNYIIIQ